MFFLVIIISRIRIICQSSPPLFREKVSIKKQFFFENSSMRSYYLLLVKTRAEQGFKSIGLLLFLRSKNKRGTTWVYVVKLRISQCPNAFKILAVVVSYAFKTFGLVALTSQAC